MKVDPLVLSGVIIFQSVWNVFVVVRNIFMLPHTVKGNHISESMRCLCWMAVSEYFMLVFTVEGNHICFLLLLIVTCRMFFSGFD